MGVALAMVLAATVFAAAGCGSDKPSYCTATSDLKSDVNQAASDVTSGNFSVVQADVDKIKSQAKTVVDDTKSDFPSETDAVDASVTSLADAVDALPTSPSAQQILELVPKVTGAVNAVDGLSSAVDSKC
jgi:hypothetical protein